MKITAEIIVAINKAIHERGFSGVRKLANDIGVSQNYISRWKNPKKYQKTITEEYWKKLYPHIKQYLPSDFDPEKTDSMDVIPHISKQSESQELIIRTSPGQQIIAGGVINVYGVPNEKIINALNTTKMDSVLREELRRKIFS